MTLESDPAPPPERPRRRWWQWAVAIALSALLLGGLIAWADPAALWETLRGGDPGSLAAATGFFVASCVCRWLRLPVLLEGAPHHPPTLFAVSVGHQFFNQLLPARTGELTFPLLLKRAQGTPLATGLLYLAVLRLVELATLCPLYSVAALLWLHEVGAPLPLGAVAGLAAVGVALLVGLPWLLPRSIGAGLSALGWLIARSPEGLRGRLQKVHASLRAAHEAVDALPPRAILKLTALAALMWLSLFAMYHCATIAFAPEVSFAQCAVGSAGGILSNLLPINGIGSLGTMEAGWVAGFRATGVRLDAAMASGLAVHAIAIATAGLLTGLGALLWRDPAA